ncbi:hypothetical protein [Halosimplex sp. J119]
MDDERIHRLKLAGWAVLAVVWLAIVVTDSTGEFAVPPLWVGAGLAVALAFVGVVAVVGTVQQAKLLTGAALAGGGAALIVGTVGPAWLPVAAEAASLAAELTIFAAMVLLLWFRFETGPDAATA